MSKITLVTFLFSLLWSTFNGAFETANFSELHLYTLSKTLIACRAMRLRFCKVKTLLNNAFNSYINSLHISYDFTNGFSYTPDCTMCPKYMTLSPIFLSCFSVVRTPLVELGWLYAHVTPRIFLNSLNFSLCSKKLQKSCNNIIDR